jgi:hypothetical protein
MTPSLGYLYAELITVVVLGAEDGEVLLLEALSVEHMVLRLLKLRGLQT